MKKDSKTYAGQRGVHGAPEPSSEEFENTREDEGRFSESNDGGRGGSREKGGQGGSSNR